MKNLITFFVVVFFVFLVCAACYTRGDAYQDDKPKLFHPFWGKDMGCENNIDKMEFLKNYAIYEEKYSRSIILVVRSSKNEKNLQRLNWRRAYNLTLAMKKLNNAIITIGSPTLLDPKVEVYIAGKLEDEMVIELNKDFCLSCCDHDSDYYPDIDRRKKSKAL